MSPACGVNAAHWDCLALRIKLFSEDVSFDALGASDPNPNESKLQIPFQCSLILQNRLGSPKSLSDWAFYRPLGLGFAPKYLV